ncbi:pitrilysin family protein [Elizabethkingia sp. HX WHF]|uniref:M16 family metallopeptidase n=1 Tax=Elizabethkingia TaxID=308865 RepID=UPI00099A82F1|nr:MULTISPECIES: pitrilysin family protein [Elizabethkingia]ATL45556.1 insulinase family protein [Elizabethkingia miricola]MCL1638475.1 insulinase family protein [Elizabethkingia bruuniana]MDX8564496.1 pitrilysin family protein [Elizabethkingia sp. HX WHF]OPC26469.1 peptidase M16 [Elizabethkingia bruuniana]
MEKMLFSITVFISGLHFSQQIKFEEYDLPNGLHVILHQDNKVPVVTTMVMYHVGSKDEVKGRTGFAHFFEHLLFEGTDNIKRGEWFKIVASNGGDNNASTSNDVTYYYETFPSNNEQLGLWMEADRMHNAVINQVGVDTQREVVKEEKRQNLDSRPYGNRLTALYNNLFTKHPYTWIPIGSMEDLDSAKLEEFQGFYKKYYVPNNATLVVAGDIKPEQTKKWIEEYYGRIPKGTIYPKNYPKDDPITHEKEVTVVDPNIQTPVYTFAYRTPDGKERDSYVLDMLSTYLSIGSSSVLYQRLVDQEKKARTVNSATGGLEDYGIFALFAYPMGETTRESLQAGIDAEIKKLQTTLISQEDYQKLQNQFETQFISTNSDLKDIAKTLAKNHLLKGNTNLINTEIEIYRSITREDLQNAAKKYLNSNQRIIINYMPERK